MSEAWSEAIAVARHRAEQYLVALFHETRVHDVYDRQLVLQHTAVEIGERGNCYEIRFFPAISKQTPVRGKSTLELSFAVFTPIGDLLTRRDDEEETRRPDQPNSAVTEIAIDLNPRSPQVRDIHLGMVA